MTAAEKRTELEARQQAIADAMLEAQTAVANAIRQGAGQKPTDPMPQEKALKAATRLVETAQRQADKAMQAALEAAYRAADPPGEGD